MHEAKTHLSRLVDLALAGEEIVIARRDRPLVRLTVIVEPRPNRRVGALPGLVESMGDDFNAPVEDWKESVVPAGAGMKTKRRPRRRTDP